MLLPLLTHHLVFVNAFPTQPKTRTQHARMQTYPTLAQTCIHARSLNVTFGTLCVAWHLSASTLAARNFTLLWLPQSNLMADAWDLGVSSRVKMFYRPLSRSVYVGMLTKFYTYLYYDPLFDVNSPTFRYLLLEVCLRDK